MNKIIRIAGASLALVMPASTQAADGPSFEETVEYLESYLDLGHYNGTVTLDVTRRQIVKKSSIFTTGAFDEEFDFNAIDAGYAVDGNKITLRCKAGECIARTLSSSPPLHMTSDDIEFVFYPHKVSAAQKALDHIFNNLLSPDPFED